MSQKFQELINSERPVLIDFFCNLVRAMQGAVICPYHGQGKYWRSGKNCKNRC